ncbi:MAG: hypothetical protein R3D98_13960 [Candidatus Krumholzibacteriia bacterium]
MERVVLAELEGFEAVDGDLLARREVADSLQVEQQAVAAEAFDLPVDGGRGDPQVPAICRLAMQPTTLVISWGRMSGRLSQ